MYEGLDRPRLSIDLAAIAANWRLLAKRAAPAEVAAVVKADAYGLGIDPVAQALFAAGARSFFVARAAEGVALRALLPAARIFVLDGLQGATPAEFAELALLPVLNHPHDLELWCALARERGQRLPAALHIDSGMLRLGFDAKDLGRHLALAEDALEIALVMSHLACADEPAHPMNARQLARFGELTACWRHLPRSLANSSGIFLGEAFRFDLCRPGIALWGGNPTPGRPNPMQPVVTLEAPVIQLREVDAPGAVGYGASYSVQPGARLATVPVGYADGLLRQAGAQGRARVGGIEVPFAGRISMDLITLDVSAVPGERIGLGSTVELIGGPDGIDRYAEAAGTISYEVLTRLGRRFERVYRGATSLP
jgi:alanine racemase